MTISIANQSITLESSAPKKDAVIATGAPTVGVTAVAIWAGANINPNLVQSIIGGFEVLHRYAQTNLPKVANTVQMPLGGSEADIVLNGVPTADDLVLEIGTTVKGKSQSHFVDRTFKRLREAWLEA